MKLIINSMILRCIIYNVHLLENEKFNYEQGNLI